MKRSLSLLLLLAGAVAAFSAEPKNVYQNNFDKAELDKVPEDLMVLDGGFVVKEEGGNRFLELPGAPLESFGVLFGPTVTNNVAAGARIFGTGKGRRFPTFGVGLNGVGGLKFQVSPGKKLVELFKGEDVIATAPYIWESGSWTMLRLQLVKGSNGELKAQGKAWKQEAKEPDAWQIDQAIMGEVPPGRPSIWGNPYAGTPIRYDDLSVSSGN